MTPLNPQITPENPVVELPRPTPEQWELIREFAVKTWYEGGQCTTSVIKQVAVIYGVKVSKKTLETRCAQWQLRKRLNHQDARDLLEAFSRIKASGRSDLVLIRGRVETLAHVRSHLRRTDKNRRNDLQSLVLKDSLQSSCVITLSQHPLLRPQPALNVLGKLEPILRELQRLLTSAKDNRLCIADDTAISWITSTPETIELEQSLQSAMWEGARAYEEDDVAWAGLCWRTAFLFVEHLMWQPEVYIWISYIRCCIRLHRFGLQEVASRLHQKLSSLRSFLPVLAPHRALIFALTDASLEDIVSGGLFLLEAQLRYNERLWPNQPAVHAAQKLHLVEERLYLDYQNAASVMLSDKDHAESSQTALSKYVNMQFFLISNSLLSADYQKAESLTRNCILHLEQHNKPSDAFQQVQILSSYLHNTLGNIMFHQQRFEEARVSYLTGVEQGLRDTGRLREHVLGPFRLHRTLTLLSWLGSSSSHDLTAFVHTIEALKYKMVTELEILVGVAEKKHFTPSPESTMHHASPHGSFQITASQNLLRLPNVGVDPKKVRSTREYSVGLQPQQSGSSVSVIFPTNRSPRFSQQPSRVTHSIEHNRQGNPEGIDYSPVGSGTHSLSTARPPQRPTPKPRAPSAPVS